MITYQMGSRVLDKVSLFEEGTGLRSNLFIATEAGC